MGNAGVLLTEVLYTKKTPSKEFIIIDAGMNDLVRPSYYGSYHDIQPVLRCRQESRVVDVVGPICESSDFIARDRDMQVMEPGEFLAVMSAGAYGFSMASNYNSRTRAAEVLVNGDQFHIIRKRESWEDLIRGESDAGFCQGSVWFMNQQEQQRIHFFKMTGAGNDFIVIDNRKGLVDADHCRDLVRYACRHKLSVGADGMILIENDPEVDFKWRFFNADASEAEMCGNGARCAARFASLTGIVQKPRMAFRTLAGIIKAELLGDRVKVQMTSPQSLQLDLNLKRKGGRSVSILLIPESRMPSVLQRTRMNWNRSMSCAMGHALRFHPHFQPAGTNVNFVHVQDSHHMVVRTYERGVEGETLACGTGCIASSLVAAARGRVASPVEVRTRGGEIVEESILKCPAGQQSPADFQFKEVYLEGEARIAYEADLWAETLQQ